jgi:hypothetical protein
LVGALLKMAPIDTLEVGFVEEVSSPTVTVQVFVPVAVDGLGLIVWQLYDHPPNATPSPAFVPSTADVIVVKVIVVPIGYGAEQTEEVKPAAAEPGPQ